MTRTVRRSSHDLWIRYGPSDSPAAVAIAESGLERTSASGLSHTPHIRCSAISSIAVMSHLRRQVRKQHRIKAGKNRHARKPPEDIKRGDKLGSHSYSRHCITSQCSPAGNITERLGQFTIATSRLISALDFTPKDIATPFRSGKPVSSIS